MTMSNSWMVTIDMELESQQNVGLIHVGKLNELVISDGKLSTCWLRYTWRCLPSLEKIRIRRSQGKIAAGGVFWCNFATVCYCLLWDLLRLRAVCRRLFFSVDAVLPINPCLRSLVMGCQHLCGQGLVERMMWFKKGSFTMMKWWFWVQNNQHSSTLVS